MSTQIVIGDISAPIYRFVSDRNDILAVTFSRSVDVVGAELSIDVLTPVVEYPFSQNSHQVVAGTDFAYIRSSDGYIMCTNKVYYDLRLLPYGTVVGYYHDGELSAKAYVKNVQRIGPITYRINAISAIGLLDAQNHYGGIYNAQNPQTFSSVLADIIGGAVNYTMDEAVENLPVYGWLPYASRRANLHQLLFQSGVMVGRNSSGDMHFRFLSNDDVTVVPDDRVYIEGEVDYSALASEVRITEHSFMALATDESVVEYDNTDGSETADHTFIAFRNAPLHDLSTTGTLTIEESGVNFAIVSGTGTLTGQRYTHSTRILTVEAEDSADSEQNIVSASECTLVNVANSANVAARLLAYYGSKKTVNSSIVLEGERPGDLLALNDPYYEAITGFLSTVQATVSSIIKGQCTIITDFIPPQGGNNYTDSILYTGYGSIDFEALLAQYPDKQNDLVQATLIQGGHGGYKGEDGTRGTGGNPWDFAWGTPGEGGNGGLKGEGGKVFTVSFHVSDLINKTLSYSCGTGGESDTEGTHTTLGNWTSENGALTPYGVANIFSGEIYAKSGDLDGQPGAGGSGNDIVGPSVSFDGETWYSGTKGTTASWHGYWGEDAVATGGWGGGAAVGSNGGNGGDGRRSGSWGGYAGEGGDGATGRAGEDAAQYGCGGNGGHGGGGAGVGGVFHHMINDSQWFYDFAANGAAGAGGDGGKGGDGLLMVYV